MYVCTLHYSCYLLKKVVNNRLVGVVTHVISLFSYGYWSVGDGKISHYYTQDETHHYT